MPRKRRSSKAPESKKTIDLLLLQNGHISAKTWFKIWEACNPENSKLNPYRTLFKSEVLEGDYVP